MRCQEAISILAGPELQRLLGMWTPSISLLLSLCSRCYLANLAQYMNSSASRHRLQGDSHMENWSPFLHSSFPYNGLPCFSCYKFWSLLPRSRENHTFCSNPSSLCYYRKTFARPKAGHSQVHAVSILPKLAVFFYWLSMALKWRTWIFYPFYHC